ncbi:Fic family protein [Candidatus Curtissbacteria bacterium]|nr:Fic family protein [Candidatus Curtissbacteria bacterium]
MYIPKFTITNKILKEIGRVEASKEIIENAPLVPAYEAKFRDEAIIRTVHHGTHIEGNPLNTGEVAAVLEGREVEAKDRDVQEVLNYRRVLAYIDKRRTTNDKRQNVSEKDLLSIHRLTVEKILAPNKAGKYRKTQVVVKNSKTGKVSFVPPKASEVPTLVRDFMAWLSEKSEEIHPVLAAGITHYVLAFIHPFVDGNGRSARALATMVLFARGYDIKKFFSLEEYFDRSAGKYYETLQTVSNQKAESLSDRDLTVWLEYFCQGLAEELAKVRGRVQKLSLDLKLKGRTGQLVLSERQMKLVEYLESYGSISNRAWRSLLSKFSDDTILRDLKDLQKKGLIKKKGSTKGAVYVLK